MKVVEIRTQAIWYNGEGKNTNEMFVGQIGKHILCIRVGLQKEDWRVKDGILGDISVWYCAMQGSTNVNKKKQKVERACQRGGASKPKGWSVSKNINSRHFKEDKNSM